MGTSQRTPNFSKRIFWKLFGILQSLIEMASSEELVKKISTLENKNKGIKKVTDDIRKLVIQLENRVSNLEKGGNAGAKAASQKEEEDVMRSRKVERKLLEALLCEFHVVFRLWAETVRVTSTM